MLVLKLGLQLLIIPVHSIIVDAFPLIYRQKHIPVLRVPVSDGLPVSDLHMIFRDKILKFLRQKLRMPLVIILLVRHHAGQKPHGVRHRHIAEKGGRRCDHHIIQCGKT